MGEYMKNSGLLPASGLYVDDCVRFMKRKMKENIVDLTVTSPPYDNLRNYNGYLF